MPKKYDYNGGFISAGTPAAVGGIYSMARQLQLESTNNWNKDSNFANVSVLVNGDYSQASTNFLKDNGPNNFALTLNGDVRPNNNTPFNGLYYSGYFNGSTDFLSFAGSSNFAVTTGTTPFTVEAWVYPLGTTGCVFSEQYASAGNTISIVVSMADGTNMDAGGVTVGQTICFGWYNGSAWTTAAGASAALPLGQWTHIACVFTGSTTKIFYNGQDVTKTSSPTPATTWGITGVNGDGWYIGRRWDATGSPYFNGFIKDFRFVKGTAVYTSNFTVPTAPLTTISGTSILTCQNSRFLDNSGNNVAITSNGSVAPSLFTPFSSGTGVSYPGCVYFDGNADNLTIPTNAAFEFGSGTFTIELWIYPTSLKGYQGILGKTGAADLNGWILYFETNNAIVFNTGNGAWTVSLNGGVVVPANIWSHIAVTKDSSNVYRLFVNGNQVATTTNAFTTNATAGLFYIGKWPYFPSYAATMDFGGYMTNLRIVKGTALYTSNFTPSTTPLTAVTNTSLLALQTTGAVHNSGFADRSNYNLVVNRNGNVTQGSFNPYALGWSVFINGTSDYFTVASNALFSFGTGDFTIEAWVYLTSSNNSRLATNRTPLGGQSGTWSFGLSSTTMNFTEVIPGEPGPTATFSSILNTWAHVAVNRTSGSTSLFLNGNRLTSAAQTTNFSTTQTLYIGTSPSENYIGGYISNLRIVKGTGLYTANFTPTTSSLTSVTGTSLLTFQNNRYVDNSGNNLTLSTSSAPSVQRFNPALNTNQIYNKNTYSGSYYFDGSGDYLSISTTPATALLTNNFTIEMWVYFTNATGTANHQGLYTNYSTWAANSLYWGKHISNSGYVAVYVNNYNANSALLAETSLPPSNAWTHYALVRNGTSMVLYRNGAVSASATVSATLSVTGGSNPVFIGAVGDIVSTSSLSGYICDFRVSNYAVYTAAFTPPTQPLSTNSGTVLMLENQATLFDQNMFFNFETNGDAKLSTAVTKFGTGSIALDGNTDWLFTPGNRMLNFGSGNWTVEAWVYLNAMPTSDAWPTNYTNHMVLTCCGTAGAGDGWNTIIGQTKLLIHSNDTQYAGTAHGMVINTWYHVAYVRNGNTIFFYVNGNATGSVAFTGSLGTGANNWIGCETGEGAYFNGYIDDLRVTRGIARYIGAFTPPGRLAIR